MNNEPISQAHSLALDTIDRLQNERDLLFKKNRNIQSELEEYKASFDLRWNADMRAIKRWQEAHPDRKHVWPDHADMCAWLMEQLDKLEAELKALKP